MRDASADSFGSAVAFWIELWYDLVMGEEEQKTCSLDDIYEFCVGRQDMDTWRHGYSCRHLLNVNGKRYLTERIRYSATEGCELDHESTIKIYPAKVITKEVWVAENEV